VLTVVNEDGTTPHGSLIDDIDREGARRMLAAALEAEVNAYITELADQRDDFGRRLVVRNGFHQPRKVTTAAGTIEVLGEVPPGRVGAVLPRDGLERAAVIGQRRPPPAHPAPRRRLLRRGQTTTPRRPRRSPPPAHLRAAGLQPLPP
jgi:hypothetical protein